ncbi:hypothetical protein LSH36_39g00100 [Paralvinella palmiformis]|uniref:Uncharacterized protein n=1 Tax=Paralvinella palmiformis TaxID=53620 RepID=A0AAD9K8F4_9ANNE|nr:hypothetical protein LSH36_39g00100 [Paralvinella palmiformis]
MHTAQSLIWSLQEIRTSDAHRRTLEVHDRVWSIAMNPTGSVMKWEEPFDSTLYCVQSDGHYAVITGTARHGMVRLWDKRHSRPIQMYYVGRGSSPVYSLAYDSGHLYVALDKGINMLDFTVR